MTKPNNNIVEAMNKALEKQLGFPCLITKFEIEVYAEGLGTMSSYVEFYSTECLLDAPYVVQVQTTNNYEAPEFRYKHNMYLVKGSKVRKGILKAMLKFN